MSFSSLGLSEQLVRAVTEKNYLIPTPIQAAVIPEVLKGGDVWASAQTGSGKTGGFALPILQVVMSSRRETPRRIRALILVPTRELAGQVGESVPGYGAFLPEAFKAARRFGGGFLH